jgi:hypothetical protein
MAYLKGPGYRILIGGVIIAAGIVVTLSITGVRERGVLLVSKIRGATTEPWSEVAVQMVPYRWQGDARKLMRKRAEEWNRQLNFPLQLDSQNRLSYSIFLGPTPNLRQLNCHYTVLAEGQTPHPPHVHDDEEIIVPLAGEVDIIRAAGTGSSETQNERIGFGRIVYHTSSLPHTIRAVGPGPSGYLVLRWSAPAGEETPLDAIPAGSFDFSQALAAEPLEKDCRSRTLIFEGPTHLLARLHAHLSIARPGEGSEPHQDAHDVVVIVLKGTVETLCGRVEAPGIIFHPAGRTHFVRCVGEQPAGYLAVEFLERE